MAVAVIEEIRSFVLRVLRPLAEGGGGGSDDDIHCLAGSSSSNRDDCPLTSSSSPDNNPNGSRISKKRRIVALLLCAVADGDVTQIEDIVAMIEKEQEEVEEKRRKAEERFSSKCVAAQQMFLSVAEMNDSLCYSPEVIEFSAHPYNILHYAAASPTIANHPFLPMGGEAHRLYKSGDSRPDTPQQQQQQPASSSANTNGGGQGGGSLSAQSAKSVELVLYYEKILEKIAHVDPNARAQCDGPARDSTPMHMAVIMASVPSVRMLISAGASVRAQRLKFVTVLQDVLGVVAAREVLEKEQYRNSSKPRIILPAISKSAESPDSPPKELGTTGILQPSSSSSAHSEKHTRSTSNNRKSLFAAVTMLLGRNEHDNDSLEASGVSGTTTPGWDFSAKETTPIETRKKSLTGATKSTKGGRSTAKSSNPLFAAMAAMSKNAIERKRLLSDPLFLIAVILVSKGADPGRSTTITPEVSPLKSISPFVKEWLNLVLGEVKERMGSTKKDSASFILQDANSTATGGTSVKNKYLPAISSVKSSTGGLEKSSTSGNCAKGQRLYTEDAAPSHDLFLKNFILKRTLQNHETRRANLIGTLNAPREDIHQHVREHGSILRNKFTVFSGGGDIEEKILVEGPSLRERSGVMMQYPSIPDEASSGTSDSPTRRQPHGHLIEDSIGIRTDLALGDFVIVSRSSAYHPSRVGLSTVRNGISGIKRSRVDRNPIVQSALSSTTTTTSLGGPKGGIVSRDDNSNPDSISLWGGKSSVVNRSSSLRSLMKARAEGSTEGSNSNNRGSLSEHERSSGGMLMAVFAGSRNKNVPTITTAGNAGERTHSKNRLGGKSPSSHNLLQSHRSRSSLHHHHPGGSSHVSSRSGTPQPSSLGVPPMPGWSPSTAGNHHHNSRNRLTPSLRHLSVDGHHHHHQQTPLHPSITPTVSLSMSGHYRAQEGSMSGSGHHLTLDDAASSTSGRQLGVDDEGGSEVLNVPPSSHPTRPLALSGVETGELLVGKVVFIGILDDPVKGAKRNTLRKMKTQLKEAVRYQKEVVARGENGTDNRKHSPASSGTDDDDDHDEGFSSTSPSMAVSGENQFLGTSQDPSMFPGGYKDDQLKPLRKKKNIQSHSNDGDDNDDDDEEEVEVGARKTQFVGLLVDPRHANCEGTFLGDAVHYFDGGKQMCTSNVSNPELLKAITEQQKFTSSRKRDSFRRDSMDTTSHGISGGEVGKNSAAPKEVYCGLFVPSRDVQVIRLPSDLKFVERSLRRRGVLNVTENAKTSDNNSSNSKTSNLYGKKNSTKPSSPVQDAYEAATKREKSKGRDLTKEMNKYLRKQRALQEAEEHRHTLQGSPS